MHPDLDPAVEPMLRQVGLRVTQPRIAVLNAVQQNPHGDTDTIIRTVRESLPEVSTQAVYDVLRALTTAGLLRKIEPAGSVARYERRTGDNHHHLVCRACAKIVDIDCAVGAAPCLSPVDSAGFEVDVAEVIYWGRCPECRAQGQARAGADDGPVSDPPV